VKQLYKTAPENPITCRTAQQGDRLSRLGENRPNSLPAKWLGTGVGITTSLLVCALVSFEQAAVACSFKPSKQVDSASSQIYPTTYPSFTEWCLHRNQVAPATQTTIDRLLSVARTPNCSLANQELIKTTKLELYLGNISDLRPLTSLTNLTYLDLSSNQISDLRPLASLSKLTYLALGPAPLRCPTHGNQIKDVSPLSSLTNLTYLDLRQNQIQDPTALKTLTKLQYLGLWRNPIKNRICPVQPESICHF
jgi:hypothetical protein